MRIDPKPARPPAESPTEARYWDPRDTEAEARRVFEVCHNCRMCVNYCGSFPDLFSRIDRDIDAGATGSERLTDVDFRAVTDLCWQCKLCYIKCPYTPDEGHEWALDFPRLLMRLKAHDAKENGVSLQDKVLGEPGLLGAMTAGPLANFANLVNAQRLVRKVAAKTAGISAEFPLPTFATTTFSRWLDEHEALPEAGQNGTVAMFATCIGDYNFPSMPANAVRVLEKNGYAVTRPAQVCCGIPNLDGGDIAAAQEKARINVASLLREIDKGHVIVVPGPTCSYTIKKEYPDLLGTKEAQRVAEHTFDVMEFLERLRRQKTLNRDFTQGLGKVAYHAACHLRAQKIGVPGARILGTVQETEVEIVDQCSAVDGTWGMKEQHYAMGKRYAQKLARGLRDAEARLMVTDCMLSARRIFQENDAVAVHPVQALAEAYGIAVGVG